MIDHLHKLRWQYFTSTKLFWAVFLRCAWSLGQSNQSIRTSLAGGRGSEKEGPDIKPLIGPFSASRIWMQLMVNVNWLRNKRMEHMCIWIGYYFQTCVSQFKEAEDCHAFFSLFLVIPKKEKKKQRRKKKPDSLVKVSP